MQHFGCLVNYPMFKLCWQEKKNEPFDYSDNCKMDILMNGNFIKKI